MRSHYCGQVTADLLENEISLVGWVHRRRDHGGVIFIDLRDREGLVQVVVNPDQADCFQKAESLRHEFVIQVKGKVRRRPEGSTNPTILSGDVEIETREIHILNPSDPLPFTLDDKTVGEETRLHYRYLDMRRPEILDRLILRAKITRFMRHFLDEQGFLDIETPCLTRATPEGARDYLVPSRTRPGSFFALPQSPQQFKQLLMMGGIDRYYQIVRCFRDEDLRADRQPEFTQLDIETSFLNELEIQLLMEEMIRGLFSSLLNVNLPNQFLRLSYAEAMSRFGSDKPDLRIPLELIELSDLLQQVEFKVFAQAANDQASRVAALCVPGGATLTRKEIDDYTHYVEQFGAKGLAYIKLNGSGKEGLQSPILKFLTDEVIESVLQRCNAQVGDIIFFGAGKSQMVNESMGALRLKIGQDLGMVEPGFKVLWVIDFPMFEVSDGRLAACHHPFTAPQTTDIAVLLAEPEQALARAYDMVINGYEVGGGSIRIHTAEMQKAVFHILKISEEKAVDKFGHLLTAMRYGCPPHGGIAFGLDRIAMLMSGASSIREVIAFPKTQTATDPLMGAPSPVEPEQLQELHIRLVMPSKN